MTCLGNAIKKFMELRLIALGVVLLAVLASCSSKSPREELDEKRTSASRKSRGPILDHFYFDSAFQPSREVEKDAEFFYKRCEFVRRTRFPSRSEFECSGPGH